METIWKYKLSVTDKQIINMPIGAAILSVQTQEDTPCMWAIVDPSRSLEARTIEIFGTGNPIYREDKRIFLGAFQLDNGLVFHVFEIFI